MEDNLASQGKQLIYLGMDMDFSVEGEGSVSMISYFKNIVKGFLDRLRKVNTSAATHLFKINKNSTKLTQIRKDLFNQLVARIL